MVPFKDGQKMGMSDGDAPQNCTEEQLSRLADAFYCVQQADLLGGAHGAKSMWDALPRDVKMDYNYTSWTYRAAK